MNVHILVSADHETNGWCLGKSPGNARDFDTIREELMVANLIIAM